MIAKYSINPLFYLCTEFRSVRELTTVVADII